MTLTEAIQAAGGYAAFGRLMRPPVSGQGVHKWAKQGWVPPNRVALIVREHKVERQSILPPAMKAALK